MSVMDIGNMQNPIAILGAFDQELNLYKDHMQGLDEVRWHDYEFWTGNLFGQAVIITKTGVGKVHAALITQKIIDAYDPKYLIFTGLAGALNPKLEIGDIVVSTDLIQYDFIAHPQFPRYTIPRPNRKDTLSIFEATPELQQAALRYSPKSHQVVAGRILTGDQFLTRDQKNDHQYLTKELSGDAVEMEGAAVAQVCVLNHKQFVVIRTISDRADSQAHLDFDSFLPQAAHNSVGVVKTILESDLIDQDSMAT